MDNTHNVTVLIHTVDSNLKLARCVDLVELHIDDYCDMTEQQFAEFVAIIARRFWKKMDKKRINRLKRLKNGL